jgi:RNA polymerase sigma-70 factor, ECF subfamily
MEPYSASNRATSNEADMELGRSSQHREPDPARETPAQPPKAEAPRFWVVPSGSGGDPAEAPGTLSRDDVPDVALIAALAAGEVEALGALYDRHARIVFALLLRIFSDRDAAEEILQEVFLRAWQHAHAFDDSRGTVRSWLYGIAHNLALNELRRRRRRPQPQPRPASADAEDDDYREQIAADSDPAVDAWCAVRDAELAQALDLLPPSQRAVLLLYGEGFSQSEIAAKLGEPLGTVKSRMRRALGHLRETLSALGGEDGWRRD